MTMMTVDKMSSLEKCIHTWYSKLFLRMTMMTVDKMSSSSEVTFAYNIKGFKVIKADLLYWLYWGLTPL